MTDAWNAILQLLNLSNAGIAYGVIFGMIGFAIQLMVRKEWPRGQLNEGSPNTLDPTKFAMAWISAIAIAIAAANWVAGRYPPPPATQSDVVVNAKYIITILVFGYVGGDLAQILKTFKDLFQKAKDALASFLPSSAQRSGSGQ